MVLALVSFAELGDCGDVADPFSSAYEPTPALLRRSFASPAANSFQKVATARNSGMRPAHTPPLKAKKRMKTAHKRRNFTTLAHELTLPPPPRSGDTRGRGIGHLSYVEVLNATKTPALLVESGLCPYLEGMVCRKHQLSGQDSKTSTFVWRWECASNRRQV